MTPPTAKTTAGSKAVRGVDINESDLVERVNQFLQFAQSNDYDVRTCFPYLRTS
jgi:hypothetical protein